jgi:hypothetical protein
MFCPNCGANITDGSTACPQCKTQINLQASKFPLLAARTNGKAVKSLGILCAAAVLLILVIAVIIIPELTRARIASNESNVTKTLDMLTTAETNYQARYPNAGYAPDIATLGPGPGGACASEADSTADHACMIMDDPLASPSCTGNQWCTKRGYRYIIQADDRRPHQRYVITAIPVKLKNTGRNNFCSTTEAEIRLEETSTARTTPYTAEECAALPSFYH